MTVRGCFGLGTADARALVVLKKERKKDRKNEADETRFSQFPGSSLW